MLSKTEINKMVGQPLYEIQKDNSNINITDLPKDV